MWEQIRKSLLTFWKDHLPPFLRPGDLAPGHLQEPEDGVWISGSALPGSAHSATSVRSVFLALWELAQRPGYGSTHG